MAGLIPRGGESVFQLAVVTDFVNKRSIKHAGRAGLAYRLFDERKTEVALLLRGIPPVCQVRHG